MEFPLIIFKHLNYLACSLAADTANWRYRKWDDMIQRPLPLNVSFSLGCDMDILCGFRKGVNITGLENG